jgi:uncharacterized membrane protein
MGVARMSSLSRGDKVIILLQMMYFVFLAISAAYLILRWHDIPDRYPVHWSSLNAPNGWEERTVGDVFWPLFMAAMIGGIIFLGATKYENVLLKIVLILLVYFIGFSLEFSAVWFPFRSETTMPIGFIVAMIIGAVIFNLLLVIAIAFSMSDKELSIKNISEDRRPYYSKWGFYRNQSDPDLWVPKLYGIGWTINLGLTKGRVIALALLIVPLAIIAAIILFLSF